MDITNNITHFKPCGGNYDKPLEIIYYLLGTCNYNCDYCAWRDLKYKENSFEIQKQILDNLFKIRKKSNLFLFGGEPTLCTYFKELIEYIFKNKPKSMTVELQTHGELNPIIIEQIKKYNINVSVSIHYNNIKSITKVLKNILLLNNYNILHRIDFMFEEKNIKKQKIFFKMLEDKNLLPVITPTFGYMNLPDFKKQYSDAKLLYDSFKDCIEKCKDIEDYEISIDNGDISIKDASELYQMNLNFNGWKCNAGSKMVIIDNKGNFNQCTSSYFYDTVKQNIFTNYDRFIKMITSTSCICKYTKCNWDLWVDRVKQ
tara:strand:+ start:12434 stop:13378 length:945 start_codon:yes stop_codon:yes gene_type:complete